MANKGSYFAKHKAQIHGTEAERAARPQQAPISPELRATFEDGKVIFIDKDLHWTSFDVVRKIRNAIKIKKVGHAGTLDPLATGLLIVCTGKFTKKINEYMAAEKEYTGSFTLGATTPTYDKESTPENFSPFEHITASDIDLAIQPFTISLFEITRIQLPEVHFKVVCSTGTYIRSLAHDVGAALGCGAYLSELRRNRIGDFSVAEAVSVDQFMASLLAMSSTNTAE